MPENLESLKVISNNISSYLSDFENNKKKLKSEISKILPILKSLKKSLNPEEVDHYNTLKTSIRNIDKLRIDNKKIGFIDKHFNKEKVFTEDYADDIDIKLSRLITDIENIGKDHQRNLIS